MSSAANLYASVINDVIQSVKDSFLDEGVDENVLQELKGIWEAKLAASKTIDHAKPQESALDSRRAAAGGRGGAAGGGANASGSANGDGAAGGSGGAGGGQQQLVITDPDRLVPVQITIPAQPGNLQSQPRALTVQVPAHALQPSSPSSSVLQSLLTQAITQALDLPESHAAVFLQEQINATFNLRQAH